MCLAIALQVLPTSWGGNQTNPTKRIRKSRCGSIVFQNVQFDSKYCLSVIITGRGGVDTHTHTHKHTHTHIHTHKHTHTHTNTHTHTHTHKHIHTYEARSFICEKTSVRPSSLFTSFGFWFQSGQLSCAHTSAEFDH